MRNVLFFLRPGVSVGDDGVFPSVTVGYVPKPDSEVDFRVGVFQGDPATGRLELR